MEEEEEGEKVKERANSAQNKHTDGARKPDRVSIRTFPLLCECGPSFAVNFLFILILGFN